MPRHIYLLGNVLHAQPARVRITVPDFSNVAVLMDSKKDCAKKLNKVDRSSGVSSSAKKDQCSLSLLTSLGCLVLPFKNSRGA